MNVLSVQRETSQPELPLEVWERVVDLISSSAKTLSRVSLVCSAFRRRCQWHLFRHVAVADWPTASSREFMRFLLLIHGHENIGSLVQELHMKCPGPDGFIVDILPHIGPKLPNVRSLLITGLDLTKLPHPVQNALVADFCHVARLALSGIRFQLLSQLLDFLSHFNKLEALHVSSITFGSTGFNPGHESSLIPRPPSYTCLKELQLHLGQTHDEALLLWMLREPARMGLERLEINILWKEDGVIQELASLSSSSLRALNFILYLPEQGMPLLHSSKH
jgi:hypothetical protein